MTNRTILPLCLIAMVASSFIIRGTMSTQYSSFWSPRTKTTIVSNSVHSLELLQQRETHIIFASLRGGSIVEGIDEEDASGNNEDEDDDDDEETTTKVTKKTSSIASMGTVQLFISTNWGNSVIDHKVELNSKRTKTIADLKKSLSKQLPGRPPMLALDLVYEGRILDEETLMEELFEDEDEDDDDEDEEEEDNEPHRKLTLNIVPPVDPKFMTELGPKLMFYSDDVDDDNNFIINSATDIDSLTTTTLIDAYYLNQVAMSLNAHLLADPNTPSSPYTRLESIEQGRQLRDELCAQIGPEKWEKLMQVTTEKSLNDNKEEWRGERYRSGKGGVTTQLKTTLQTNLNVNWTDAIKNFLLFLFFGYFGGKNSFSRHLLLWGAPLSFALQARPVKMWFKVIFYMLSNPPSILLSFLPAPQQAILSVDLKSSCVALYGEDGAKNILKQLGLEVEKTIKRTTTTVEEESDEEKDEDNDDIDDLEYDEDEDEDEDEEE